MCAGNPAPATTSLVEGDWFFGLINAVEAPGSKVDFIAPHHKPQIWVTEFAMVDQNVQPSWETPRFTMRIQYLVLACQTLEGQDLVERYFQSAIPWCLHDQ